MQRKTFFNDFFLAKNHSAATLLKTSACFDFSCLGVINVHKHCKQHHPDRFFGESDASSMSAKVCDEFPKMSVETSPFMCFLVVIMRPIKEAHTWTEFNSVPISKPTSLHHISIMIMKRSHFLIPE